jgi:hypothetical protein
VLALSASPAAADPLIVGRAVSTGAGGGGDATITPVCAEPAGVDPPALLAVTTARTVRPTSPAFRVYEGAVAPTIFEQFSPTLLQFSH